MMNPLKPLLFCLAILPLQSLRSQADAPVDAPPEAPASAASALTAEQLESLKKQLTELESTIGQLRGNTLGGVLEKLRTAVQNNGAAKSFYNQCRNEVMIKRQGLSREETKRMEERMKQQEERESQDKSNGDMSLAIRLNLQYLILTLEAAEKEDKATLIPKLMSFIQAVVEAAPSLKGRAFQTLSQGVTGGQHPVVDAYQLQRYLRVKDWSQNPGDIRGMIQQTVLPWYVENKPESLNTIWDQMMSAEMTLRQGYMSTAAYELWSQNELPSMRWEKANFLLEHGDDKVMALAEMFKLIRDTPHHGDAMNWLKALRSHIEPEANAQNP